jgi:hypothetical protein
MVFPPEIPAGSTNPGGRAPPGGASPHPFKGLDPSGQNEFQGGVPGDPSLEANMRVRGRLTGLLGRTSFYVNYFVI